MWQGWPGAPEPLGADFDGGGVDLARVAAGCSGVAPCLFAAAGPPTPDPVIAGLRVRGFTRPHPDVPVHLRGTYAGLAPPASVDYLTGLGVTAVELLPVAHFLDEPDLRARGLVNYWGYNPIAFFAPHARYAATWGGQVGEFRAMTHAL